MSEQKAKKVGYRYKLPNRRVQVVWNYTAELWEIWFKRLEDDWRARPKAERVLNTCFSLTDEAMGVMVNLVDICWRHRDARRRVEEKAREASSS